MEKAAKSLEVTASEGVYYLSGAINETSDLSKLNAAEPPLRMNLGHVKQINSLGVLLLINFLKTWGDKPFEYHECRPEFIHQVNMLGSLLGHSGTHGRVISLYIPYECDRCSHHDEYLYKTQDIRVVDDSAQVDKKHCSKCGAPMEIAEDPDHFFTFLVNFSAAS